MGGRAGINSWGPAAWTFMHTVSFVYPEYPNQEDKDRMHKFMHALAAMLPCIRCRRDWTHYLSQNLASSSSTYLQSRENFVRFVIDGHNHVNRRLSKRVYSYEEVRQLYTHARSSSVSVTFIVIAVCVILCVVALFVYRRMHKMRNSKQTYGSQPLSTFKS